MKKLIALVTSALTTPFTSASSSPSAVESFMQHSLEGLQEQTAIHRATWQLGKEQSWYVDQDLGIIRFEFADGVVATAPVQIVGTYNPQNGTFLWGWDHPSVTEPLRRTATLVRHYGAEHKIADFTEREVTCTEAEAWEFTAVAVRLDSANGAYRANTGGALVYMTFGTVTLTKPLP
ncbi:DUF6882 domain-containing protein [Aeromonas sanarellii]|uniref:DUF6882 domain-containing protein n=1 Tax=Aeromonas sanarellii TaxID=633415 RepID=UPI003BA1DC10